MQEPHMTPARRAQLETALLQRRQALEDQIAEHHSGLSRAEHASEVLQQDGDDAPQREGERELDMALSDRAARELGEVDAALRRLPDAGFGLCTDCGATIAFERLQVEPWALRCIACESRREAA